MNNLDELNFLRAEVDRLQKENQKSKIDYSIIESSLIKMDSQTKKILDENLELRSKTELSHFKIKKLESEVQAQKDVLYKIAHSINNDLSNAGNLLENKYEDEEIRNAFYFIKRIAALVNLNLWLLKKDELKEEWSNFDLFSEIERLIRSTKDGILTLMTSEEHSSKLKDLNVKLSRSGNTMMDIGNEKLDIIISLILQDFIRNAFKYSEKMNPMVRIDVKGDDENFIIINFVNNGLMHEKYIRYLNQRDEEPEISDSSKVGLRSILEWIDILEGCKINASNFREKSEFKIELTLPRTLVYEKN